MPETTTTALDTLDPKASALVTAFHDGIHAIFGDTVECMFLYGSITFPPSPTVDIDFTVVLSTGVNEAQDAQVRDLHASIDGAYPPIDELDGYYISSDAARGPEPPTSLVGRHAVDDMWPIHRAHIHAGQTIVLTGPDPATIVPAASWDEIEPALRDELDSLDPYLAESPRYGCLQFCRIAYSLSERDVVLSKFDAARWGLAALPVRWHPLIRAAVRLYAGTATTDDAELAQGEIMAFRDEMRRRIDASDKAL